MEQKETRRIESARVEHHPHRIQALLHRVMPSMVTEPQVTSGDQIQPGDRLLTQSGKRLRIGGVVRSMEGSRYAFSDLPNPSDR